jgi:hypothetical protein
MDVLEKNMIITTTQTLLNYGSLEEELYTLIGQVVSDSPFTIRILSDDIVIPFVPTISEGDKYILSFNLMESNNQFFINPTNKFKLQFDTTNEKQVNLKLWKPYPISPVLPNV